MKTKKKFILLISTFILLFSTVYSQNAINKNGSYSNFYDFLNQYFNDPLYHPFSSMYREIKKHLFQAFAWNTMC